MWIPPKVCDSFFDLYGGGRVYFGRAQRGGGQSAGTPPIMARIECEPYYPPGWFVVSRKKAMLAINRLMQDNTIDGQTFLPDWLVSDCYRGEVERLRSIMAAAADEIEEHWEAHCDKDGFGPVNLVRRLRTGKGDYRKSGEWYDCAHCDAGYPDQECTCGKSSS